MALLYICVVLKLWLREKMQDIILLYETVNRRKSKNSTTKPMHLYTL